MISRPSLSREFPLPWPNANSSTSCQPSSTSTSTTFESVTATLRIPLRLRRRAFVGGSRFHHRPHQPNEVRGRFRAVCKKAHRNGTASKRTRAPIPYYEAQSPTARRQPTCLASRHASSAACEPKKRLRLIRVGAASTSRSPSQAFAKRYLLSRLRHPRPSWRLYRRDSPP